MLANDYNQLTKDYTRFEQAVLFLEQLPRNQRQELMLANNYHQLAEDYARIEQAIMFMEQNFRHQPDLKAVAASVGLSEYHFQRLFSRWAGISPKRFLQFLTVEYAKQLLDESRSLLEVTYESGLSSPGRLHDLFVTCEAMTPGEFKEQADGLTITYGFHPSPFGETVLAITERGICGLLFVSGGNREETLQELTDTWPKARFRQDSTQTRPFMERIFNPVKHQQALPVILKGTNFQIKVWQALLKIPPGTVVSYEDIAAQIGRPGAALAVGMAAAHNPIGYVIPCHRVIRKIGVFGNYHWGTARKKAILGWEVANKERSL
jgi:AraC family transcriptional regulator of adaptative response/methylated-DNA-[protein]-cysteine methyltransferase